MNINQYPSGFYLQSVLKTLSANKVMIKEEEDGVYIRLAGDTKKQEAFSLEWTKVFTKETSKTASYAEKEINILIKTVNEPIIGPFKKELIALCDRFGKSGQSGGSVPFTAAALGHAVKTLCMQRPLCDITGVEEEWVDVAEMNGGEILFQNNRHYGVFKESNGDAYYVDAIVFKDQRGYTFTSNAVNMQDGSRLRSGQYIKKFPFKPKTFYVDVVSIETKKDWWESHVKDEKQLKSVFKYYNKRVIN